MSDTLTNKTIKVKNTGVLTNDVNRPFHIKFGPDICDKYNLSCCGKDGLIAKKIGQFLSKTVGNSWDQVEKNYKRTNDTNDKFNGHQIIHLKFSKSGRIHGYIEGTVFHVVRIDPNHDFHDK
ncbi:hypothetical protein PT072_08240 [Erysipelothrix rhusiopathiae]|nr:hypothetical protein [Erysipelothrix rhusiopathiae]